MRDFESLESLAYYIEKHHKQYTTKELSKIIVNIVEVMPYSFVGNGLEQAKHTFELFLDNYENEEE